MVIFVESPNNNLGFSSTSVLHFLESFEKFFNHFCCFCFSLTIQFNFCLVLSVFVNSNTLAAHCCNYFSVDSTLRYFTLLTLKEASFLATEVEK